MRLKIVEIYFRTPVHIGDIGIGLEESSKILHSDTIFGGIVNALSYLGEDVEEFVNAMNSDEIKFSSAFPFSGEEYFFPKPMIRMNYATPSLREKYSKKIKELEFIEKKFFEKWISGGSFAEEDLAKVKNPDFYKIYDIPKVVIDRETSSTSIYYLGVLRFMKGGMFFLLDAANNKLIERYIKPALKVLEDEGFGGKRTWGLGKFAFKIRDFELRVPNTDDAYITLSLAIPQNFRNLLFWQLKKRGGWIFSRYSCANLRKPTVMMISEGSVFGGKDEGRIVDLCSFTKICEKVGHHVYVNGKTFTIQVIAP